MGGEEDDDYSQPPVVDELGMSATLRSDPPGSNARMRANRATTTNNTSAANTGTSGASTQPTTQSHNNQSRPDPPASPRKLFKAPQFNNKKKHPISPKKKRRGRAMAFLVCLTVVSAVMLGCVLGEYEKTVEAVLKVAKLNSTSFNTISFNATATSTMIRKQLRLFDSNKLKNVIGLGTATTTTTKTTATTTPETTISSNSKDSGNINDHTTDTTTTTVTVTEKKKTPSPTQTPTTKNPTSSPTTSPDKTTTTTTTTSPPEVVVVTKEEETNKETPADADQDKPTEAIAETDTVDTTTDALETTDAAPTEADKEVDEPTETSKIGDTKDAETETTDATPTDVEDNGKATADKEDTTTATDATPTDKKDDEQTPDKDDTTATTTEAAPTDSETTDKDDTAAATDASPTDSETTNKEDTTTTTEAYPTTDEKKDEKPTGKDDATTTTTDATPTDKKDEGKTADKADATEATDPTPTKDNTVVVVENDTATPGSISLVTSFWAQPPKQKGNNLHRLEIQAAMVNNRNNQYLDQIVVILDGATKDANCTHLQTQLDELEADVVAKMPGYVKTAYETNKKEKLPVFTCIDREEKQPNYYEIFKYATDPKIVTSDVVIVANADQAFDDTVQWAGKIKDDAVLVLPTWGFDKKQVPQLTKEYFKFVHGGKDAKMFQEGAVSRCSEGEKSWDGYVFHRKLIAGHLESDNFMRYTVVDDPKQDYFVMNEVGAENAALYALLQNVPDAKDAVGCSVIQMWHFHGGLANMHVHEKADYWHFKGKGKNKLRAVPRPWRTAGHPIADAFVVKNVPQTKMSGATKKEEGDISTISDTVEGEDADKSAAVRRTNESAAKTSTKAAEGTVSLVSSFFASGLLAKEQPHPHLAETMMAFLNNINNPHFNQVVVILDGSSSKANCATFERKLQDLQAQFQKWNNSGTDNGPEIVSSKLTCVDREQGQPNYFEMFSYASDPEIITSDVVLMANADQAYDESVKWAGKIKDEAIGTLPSWGYDKATAPKSITNYFEFSHLPNVSKVDNVKRAFERSPMPNKCKSVSSSWDGYVFHPALIRGRIKEEDFVRPSFLFDLNEKGKRVNITNSTAMFKMNEQGAENAGFASLIMNIPEAFHAQTCEVIRGWHFHAAEKMHADNKVDQSIDGKTQRKFLWYHEDPKIRKTVVPEPARRASKWFKGLYPVEPEILV
ncbi:expressed unknown protein [Seminavis robusta]|uniref:Uncharacterized protein n=1 Tax=Seminavis robusta TaxID=568900 RepID=A0A9N8E1S6_9STRA|nr:expressed unknown protein [Seminavis robusta]|eukprot:Sro420_g139370.1 n/a (1190) ;mRNA; r:49101-52670